MSNPLARFLSSRRRLTRAIGLTRELHALNDSLSAVMLHFNIPTLAERRRMEHDADEERQRIERNPDLVKPPDERLEFVEALRERAKRHEPITDEELLTADRILREDEEEGKAAW